MVPYVTLHREISSRTHRSGKKETANEDERSKAETCNPMIGRGHLLERFLLVDALKGESKAYKVICGFFFKRTEVYNYFTPSIHTSQ